jgi:hypothetical protein
MLRHSCVLSIALTGIGDDRDDPRIVVFGFPHPGG